MKERNLLEDLVAVSPGMEIWWDSSPVIFGNWCKKMLAKAEPGDQDNAQAPVRAHVRHSTDPMGQLFRGVTTNPPLSLAAFKDDPPYWQKVADDILKANQRPRHRVAVLAALQRGRQAGLRHVPAALRGVGPQGGLPLRPVRPAQRLRRGGHAQAGRSRSTPSTPTSWSRCPAPPRATRSSRSSPRAASPPTTRSPSCCRSSWTAPSRSCAASRRPRPTASTCRTGARSSPTWRPATATSAACARPARRRASSSPRATCAWPSSPSSRRPTASSRSATTRARCSPARCASGPTVDGKLRLWHLEEKAGAAVVVTCPPSLHRRGHQLPGRRGHQVRAEPHRRRSAQGRHGQAAAHPVLRARLRRETATRAPSTTRTRRS